MILIYFKFRLEIVFFVVIVVQLDEVIDIVVKIE